MNNISEMDRTYLTLKYRIEQFPDHEWVYFNCADRESLRGWLHRRGMLIQSFIGAGPEIDLGVYIDGNKRRLEHLYHHLLAYELEQQRTDRS